MDTNKALAFSISVYLCASVAHAFVFLSSLSEPLPALQVLHDVLLLAPHRVQLLLRHQRQLIFQMRAPGLTCISVTDRALRLLHRCELNGANKRLPMRRVEPVAFTPCVIDGAEYAGISRASIARYVSLTA